MSTPANHAAPPGGVPVDLARKLCEWMAGTDIALIELSGPGASIRLRREQGTQPSIRVNPPEHGGIAQAGPAPTVVRAGSVGIVLHAHPLRTEALAAPGQPVVAGQALALLQIGLVLLPVPAPRAGRVTRIVAPHGSVVGWGEPLIEIE